MFVHFITEKEEKAKRDLEEGKPEKKKRKPASKKGKGQQGRAAGSSGGCFCYMKNSSKALTYVSEILTLYPSV